MTRTCKLCGATDKSAEFYKGVNCRCKECHKEQVRLNRREKSDQYAAYEKMRYKRDPHRLEANKRYAKTAAGKASHAKSVRKIIALNPQKRAAHVILGNAVRSGRIKKPAECSRCGVIPPRRQLHGHHDDYAKPLDVEWICSGCHGLEHFGKAPEPQKSKRIRGRYVRRNS